MASNTENMVLPQPYNQQNGGLAQDSWDGHKTGVTVEEILHISRQFVKDHCIVEPLIGEPVVTGSNEYSDLNSTMGT